MPIAVQQCEVIQASLDISFLTFFQCHGCPDPCLKLHISLEDQYILGRFVCYIRVQFSLQQTSRISLHQYCTTLSQPFKRLQNIHTSIYTSQVQQALGGFTFADSAVSIGAPVSIDSPNSVEQTETKLSTPYQRQNYAESLHRGSQENELNVPS